MFRNRASLCWLAGPPVLYLAAVPLVNRVEPVIFGLPLFMLWMLVATLLTPGCVALAALGDPVWRARRATAQSAVAEAQEVES